MEYLGQVYVSAILYKRAYKKRNFSNMTTYPGLSSKHGPGALNPRMAKTCAVSKTLFIYCVGIGHC